MSSWIVFFLVLSATQSALATDRIMKIDDELISNPCKPGSDEDGASSDSLVNHMFEAYKKQAQSESPPGAHATMLKEVNAHELLARLFIFIDGKLRDEATALNPLCTDTDEQRWAANRKWPYRCFDTAVARALDTVMSHVLTLMIGLADDNMELALHELSIVLRLPQFAPYVQNIQKTQLQTLCPKILSSSSADITELYEGYKLFKQPLLPLADTACKPPYESTFFCSFPKFWWDLHYMHSDYVRAGNSAELQKFAFFWFLAPGMTNICEDPFQAEVSAKVLKPFAKLAVARLDEIIGLGSTTGSDLRKIRTFIYDYRFTHLTELIETSLFTKLPLLVQTPFRREEDPGSKYHNLEITIDPHPFPEKDLFQSFRYFLLTLADMENALASGADIADIQGLARNALFWFLHPDFHLDSNQHFDSFLDGIDNNIAKTNSLVRLGVAVKHYKNTLCIESNPNRPKKYCNMYDVLFDIEIFSATYQERPMWKILNPSSNYKKILELSAMRSVQSDIAALQVNQEQLEQSILGMRSSLGDHFHQLATFDQDKAEYDVGFLQAKIGDFTIRISDIKIKDKLYTLLYYAIGSNTAEIAQLATQLAAAVAENCNPIAWLTGGANVQDVLDQANALAKAGVDTAKLIALHETIFPRITEKGREISAAISSNARVHRKLNTTFHQLKNKESVDIDAVQNNFLAEYAAYDPGWSSGDIAEYTVLLKEVIEELCEILYAGGTVASAVVQIVGASKMNCLKTRVDAEILDAVYQEMYDFQYEFMEAMAQAIRALIAKHSANNVRNIPEKADDPATYRLRLRAYVDRIKLQSKQHTLLALKEVCDVDEYKNAGVPTKECNDVFQSLASTDIDKVIGHAVDECPAHQTSTFNARFPASLNPDRNILEPGILDLTKLYAGELTPFQIPYQSVRPWTRRFVSTSIPTMPEVGLYVKQMEIYLPDLTDNAAHDVRVIIKQDGSEKVARSGNVKYGFSTPKIFNLLYGENKHTCANNFVNSPYPKLCEPGPSKLCIATKGVVSGNEIAPPLHSKWLIRFVLPNNLPILKPPADGSFTLRGVLTVCHKFPETVDPSDVYTPNMNLPLITRTNRCCDDGEFWYISEFSSTIQFCMACPQGYTTKLGGLYCHEKPTGATDKQRKKHTKHYHHRHKKVKNLFRFASKSNNLLRK